MNLHRFIFVAVIIALICIIGAAPVQGQGKLDDKLAKARELVESGEQPVIRLELKDGTLINGTLLAMDKTSMKIKSLTGEINVLIEHLDQIKFEGKEFKSHDRYGFANPNATRYLFSPSAIPLDKGEGYYQNILISFNSFHYGVTDRVSISVGIEMISAFTTLFVEDYTGLIAYGNVKASAPVGNSLHVGGGVLAGGVLGSTGEDANLVIGYGLATAGNREHNVTLGVGYGLVGGKWASNPTVNLNGMTRISKSLGLVSENWYIHSQTTESNAYYDHSIGEEVTMTRKRDHGNLAFSGAIRIMSPNITFDIGLVTAGQPINKRRTTYSPEVYPEQRSNESYWLPIPIPYVDFVYKF